MTKNGSDNAKSLPRIFFIIENNPIWQNVIFEPLAEKVYDHKTFNIILNDAFYRIVLAKGCS